MPINSSFDLSSQVLKGRGSHINPQNKFDSDSGSTLIKSYKYDENDILSTKIHEVKAKTIINKVESQDIPFRYSMNPYQGCEHGCIYCYARNTHNYWGFSAGLDFESQIVVKTNTTSLLRNKLKSKNWKGTPIMVSGNTDCYQPIEKKYKITRSILQTMLSFKNPVGLITKSGLILRDLDLLKELAKNNLVSVAISIHTLNDAFRKLLEPRASSISVRLKTIEKLVENNIPVRALCAPIIPGFNDHEILPLVKKLSDIGVSSIGHIVVRLNGDIGEIFEEWITRNYPLRKDKVMNKIKSLHGGKVNDSRMGKRMKGEGKIADIIHQQFKLAISKYHKPKPFTYNLDLYNKVKNPQMKLFE